MNFTKLDKTINVPLTRSEIITLVSALEVQQEKHCELNYHRSASITNPVQSLIDQLCKKYTECEVD